MYFTLSCITAAGFILLAGCVTFALTGPSGPIFTQITTYHHESPMP